MEPVFENRCASLPNVYVVCSDPDTTGGLSVLISAPQGAAMQVRGISVLIPYHHAEGASALSGDPTACTTPLQRKLMHDYETDGPDKAATVGL